MSVLILRVDISKRKHNRSDMNRFQLNCILMSVELFVVEQTRVYCSTFSVSISNIQSLLE